jgi:hypothetical protein
MEVLAHGKQFQQRTLTFPSTFSMTYTVTLRTCQQKSKGPLSTCPSTDPTAIRSESQVALLIRAGELPISSCAT